MGKIADALASGLKGKEKVSSIAMAIIKDNDLMKELMECVEKGSEGDRGHCIEALEFASHEHPEIILPRIDFVIDHLDDEASRVRWESGKIIFSLAGKYHDRLMDSVPKLLKNAEDESTVVRWSAAMALAELAVNSGKDRDGFMKEFGRLETGEKKSNIKKMYGKAMKKLSQSGGKA